MLEVLAWAVALLVIPSLIAGLAFARRAGLDDPASIALSLPVGLAITLFAVEVADRLGAHGWMFAAATGLVGIASLVDIVGNRAGREFATNRVKAVVFPVLSCAGTFGLLCLPWRHVSTDGILGYSQLNDQVVHGLVAEWISRGRPDVSGVGWDFALAQPRAGYPVGSHELLAVVLAPIPNIERAYSPTLAVLVAFTAAIAYWLIRRHGTSNAIATVGAAFAGGSFLQLGYAGQGYLPSMAATPLILGAIALLVETATCRRRWLAGVGGGMVAGAAAATYSFSVGVFFVGPALLGLLMLWRARVADISTERARLNPIVGFCVGFVLLIAPVLGSSWKYFSSVFHPGGGRVGEIGGASDLGNLLHPLSFQTAFGSWIAADYRLDYERVGHTILGSSVEAGLTRLGIAAGVSLFVVGVVSTIIRREATLVVACSGPLVAIAYVHATQGPYYVAKTYQVFSVFFICCLFVGVEAALGVRKRSFRTTLRSNPGRVACVAALATVWMAAALASAVKESTSASIPPPIIRDDLPRAATAALHRGVSPVTLVDTSVWSYLASPGGQAPVLRSGLAVGSIPDSDALSPTVPRPRAIITSWVGGLSIPAPPYSLAGTYGFAQLYVAERGSTMTRPPIPAERGSEVGAARLPPGASRSFDIGTASTALVGVLDPDDQYLPFVSFAIGGSGWSRWDANPDMLVPAGAPGRGLTRRFDIARSGAFRVTLVGLYFHAVLTIDGASYPVSGGQLRSPLAGPIISLAAGSHSVTLRSPPGTTSYAQAFSIARTGTTSPTTDFCVGGHRYEASPGRPAQIKAPSQHLVIRDCGTMTAALDWVLPA